MTVVGGVLMLTGAALTVIAAVGVLRFPDALSRLHAAAKAAPAGIALVMVGAGATLGPGRFGFTVLVALFHVLTAPVAAHALGRAVRPDPGSEIPIPPPAALSRGARIAGLAAVWVLLWGDFTVASLAGGVVAGTAVGLLTTRPDTEPLRIRPGAALRFIAVFLALMVRSTLVVAAAALGPARLVAPAIHRIRVGPGSTPALVAAANAVSLTPGALTLAVDPMERTLTVHLIRPDERELEAVVRLHALTAAALPGAPVTEERTT
jgi:monovalent cation/proton antiporter MnhG/PhaG subunit